MTEPTSALSPLRENPGFAPALVTVQGAAGFVFQAPDETSFCFVPEDCVFLSNQARIEIDGIRYVRSGWCVRNMRYVDHESGSSYLFPDPEKLVSEVTTTAVKNFPHQVAGPGDAGTGRGK